MSTFPAVTGYRDGKEYVLTADKLNAPVYQLRERTDYLYDRLEELAGAGAFEAVRLSGVKLDSVDAPSVGDAVYYDTSTRTFKRAVAAAVAGIAFPQQSAAPTAFITGMLVSLRGGLGTVVAYGRYVPTTDFALADMLEPGETFQSGPYYLSNTFPGKLTATPRGVAVHFGVLTARVSDATKLDQVLLAPQMKDLYQSHLHMEFNLGARPAGSLSWENLGTLSEPELHARVRGLIDDDAPATPKVYLYLLGGGPAVAETTYTIKVVSTGLMASAQVYWKTLDGSDDTIPGSLDPEYGWNTGLPIPQYEREVSIGSKGMRVVLEKGGAFADWTATSNFGTLTSGTYTWTVNYPKRVTGWLPKWHRTLMTRTTITERGYTMWLFGPGSATVANADVVVTATSDGDLSTTGADFAVFVNGTLATTLSACVFGGVAYDTTLGLYFLISSCDLDGVAASGTVATGDSWLATFVDDAVGALFSYNIEADKVLSAYWPPTPAEGAVMEINGAVEERRGQFKAGVGLYTSTPRGLWFWDDWSELAPFPRDWAWNDAAPGDEDTYDFNYARNTTLRFAEMRLGRAGIVTTLRPAPDSRVVITDCRTGAVSQVGDLQIDAPAVAALRPAAVAGYMVPKQLSGTGTLLTGPIVEKLVQGPGIMLENLDIGAPAGQGKVRISSDQLSYGDFSEITLLNAKQEIVPGGRLSTYIKLMPWSTGVTTPRNVPSAFSAQMRVPYALTGRYKLAFYLTMFGLDGFDSGAHPSTGKKYARVRVTYEALPDYAEIDSGTGQPAMRWIGRSLSMTGSESGHPLGVWSGAADLTVELGRKGQAYPAYTPFVFHNDPTFYADYVAGSDDGNPAGVVSPLVPNFLLPVPGTDSSSMTYLTAGNLFAIKFEREDVADANKVYEYKGALGVVSLKWRLISL